MILLDGIQNYAWCRCFDAKAEQSANTNSGSKDVMVGLASILNCATEVRAECRWLVSCCVERE